MKRGFKFLMRAVVGLAGLFLVLVLLQLMGVGIVYHVPVLNQPLKAPVAVTSVSSNTLTLADGRVVRMEMTWFRGSLDQVIRDADHQVDIEESYPSTMVYVKKQIFYCGTGRPTIVIPIIPNRLPVYRRQSLGVADFVG